jgi:hypothetical protein
MEAQCPSVSQKRPSTPCTERKTPSAAIASEWRSATVQSDIRPLPKGPDGTAIGRKYASLRADSQTRSTSVFRTEMFRTAFDSIFTRLLPPSAGCTIKSRDEITIDQAKTPPSQTHRNNLARCKAACVKPFSEGRLKARSVPAAPYHVRMSSHPTSSSRALRNCRAEWT